MAKKLLALATLAAIGSPAGAFQFDTGDDWEIRWDNSVKFNVMSRVAKQDKDVYTAQKGASWYLADDSDLSVDRTNLGIVSTRFDILSEMDIIYKGNYGARVSASGWYDPMYDRRSDHPRDRYQTWASPSVQPGEYTDKSKDLAYLGGELLDAFVFANFNIGDIYANIRAGRHTLYWGNSLLGTGAIHGPAGSMTAIDLSKAVAVPGSEAKELFMPTGKVSTVVQLTDDLTLNAFYGFQHQEYRLAATGTYFSSAEGLTDDTEFGTLIPANIGALPPGFRGGARVNKNEVDEGDWGVNFEYYFEPLGLETAFIYMNYVGKTPEGLVADLGTRQEIDPVAGTITLGDMKWLYKNDIDLYGISLAKDIAGISVGVDLVNRRDAPLPPELGAVVTRYSSAEEFARADSDNYGGPVGDSYHAVINGLGLLSDNGIWEGGSWILEASFSWLDSCNQNCDYLDVRVSEDRVVSHVGLVFRPTWYQVFPGTDLTGHLSVGYTIDGEKAPIANGGDEENGNASIGLDFLINQSVSLNARYNVFYGPVRAGLAGLLKDRDNVSITIKKTF